MKRHRGPKVPPVSGPSPSVTISLPPATSPRAPLGVSDPPRSRSGARRRRGSAGSPELSDPVGSLEVGEHQDVEQLGAGSRSERVQTFSEPALKLVGSHGREATPFHRRPVCQRACPRDIHERWRITARCRPTRCFLCNPGPRSRPVSAWLPDSGDPRPGVDSVNQ